MNGALFGFASSVPLFHWWVFSWFSHLFSYSFYLLGGREAEWFLSETVLVPFKYFKHHQTGDILDFLKLYFATWETHKSIRELKAVELEAAKSRSIVLVLKGRFLSLLWQFKLESSVPSFFLLCFLLLCSHPPSPPFSIFIAKYILYTEKSRELFVQFRKKMESENIITN